jgi:uncharacterized protein YbcI
MVDFVTGPREPEVHRSSRMMEVANTLVKLHKRYYGKGPTTARADMVAGTLTCVLGGCLTRAEATLVDRGDAAFVRRHRLEVADRYRDEVRVAIEDLLGCRVLCALSANDPVTETQVETFVLDRPRAGG